MRRGAVKTPGGKLVAVTVQTDQSGLPVACRLDGDFFIDGDGAPLLLDDLERTLLACAREASAGKTDVMDGSALPAPAAREHADAQERAARPKAMMECAPMPWRILSISPTGVIGCCRFAHGMTGCGWSAPVPRRWRGPCPGRWASVTNRLPLRWD